MAKRMRMVSTVFSALGWVMLAFGVALCASGLLRMLELLRQPAGVVRDTAMEIAVATWYHGLAVLAGSPLMFLLGGAASALAIYHAKHERGEGQAVPSVSRAEG